MSLPPVPAPLKAVAPYLQRADELRQKEPIIAYWCTYYAAQVGIALKARDSPSRDFLFELLGSLEKLKEDIGPTDAIDIESASAAYVENFALRVFGMADNEDRSGAGTRSTAKKFLAAANFLEVLKTFPKTDVSETNEDKIRYAKWKAADIAKAFREGRKPTPGPANAYPSIEAELLELAGPPTSSSTATMKEHFGAAFSTDSVQGSPPPQISVPSSSGSPPKARRTSPHMEPADIANANRNAPQTPPENLAGLQPGSWGGRGEATPGSWSTAATPGLSTTPQQELPDDPPSSPLHKGKGKERTGSGDSLESEGSKKVHFTPSVVDETSPVSPVHNPPWQGSTLFNGTHLPSGGLEPSAPPLPPHAPTPVVPPPPMFIPSPTLLSPPPPPEPVELTPTIVAKAQKHCRFAISSLDYEDAEQAKRELRAALAVLGG
ncbi:Vta1 like-domain-containing protein [Roridomyces roridus]|uniref:Vta1 like-domain-containing protein n=1 Tax=Roridomyces roridus TaxID=1738132 RepID=A0AAD7FNZ4_9AGAR|nr:Vta1 like-domain-containing protein [Roridomyces roridus]